MKRVKGRNQGGPRFRDWITGYARVPSAELEDTEKEARVWLHFIKEHAGHPSGVIQHTLGLGLRMWESSARRVPLPTHSFLSLVC